MWPMKMASESVRQIASCLADAKRRPSLQKRCVPSLSSLAIGRVWNVYLKMFRRTQLCCSSGFQESIVALFVFLHSSFSHSSCGLWVMAGLANQRAALWLKYFGSRFRKGNVSRTQWGFLRSLSEFQRELWLSRNACFHESNLNLTCITNKCKWDDKVKPTWRHVAQLYLGNNIGINFSFFYSHGIWILHYNLANFEIIGW